MKDSTRGALVQRDCVAVCSVYIVDIVHAYGLGVCFLPCFPWDCCSEGSTLKTHQIKVTVLFGISL